MFLSLRLARGGGIAHRNGFTTAAITTRAASSSVLAIANRQHASKPRARPVMPASSLRNSCGIHTTSTNLRQAITPDSSAPAPPSTAPSPVAAPANISPEEYHELADEFLDRLYSKLEGLSEQRDDVDVEYSAGVLTLIFPPAGTYVLNKQPPNKQIWLSSPISGPKRFDWVVEGEGQHEKEGGGSRNWVYARDGTTLGDVLRKEVGVWVDME